MTLTASLLRELLHYEPTTGDFTWRTTNCARRAGTVAGRIMHIGYVQIMVGGGRYLGHRLAWLYVHGQWPAKYIDHINGVRDDNRLANLREASPSQNQANQRISKRNKSGFKGVTLHRCGNWQAVIGVHGQNKYLGVFEDAEDAARAYDMAARRHHGEFARVNFSEARS